MLTDCVNREVLKERSNHSIANHDRGDFERLELQGCQTGSLVVGCGLGEVCLVELANFMQVGDKSKGSSIALRTVSESK